MDGRNFGPYFFGIQNISIMILSFQIVVGLASCPRSEDMELSS
jgi:hypothetical protein